MKILLQIGVVFGVFWASQFIESVLPFSFPASVISLILMLILLAVGFVKHEHIKDFSDFMLGNLVFLFIPVSSGIINYVDLIADHLVGFVAVCVISLVLTYAATSYAVQLTRKLMEKGGGKK